jgi:hypothetical protein
LIKPPALGRVVFLTLRIISREISTYFLKSFPFLRPSQVGMMELVVEMWWN